MRLPSANCPALKKYGDWRPALVRKSPNLSAPARIANSTNSRRSAASPDCAAGAAAACMNETRGYDTRLFWTNGRNRAFDANHHLQRERAALGRGEGLHGVGAAAETGCPLPAGDQG